MIIGKKKLSKKPRIESTSHIVNTSFGIYCEVGEYNNIENCQFGDFSYTGQYCFLQNVSLSKFVNIAACVRIGATDHPYDRPSLHHFTYRPTMYGWAKEDDWNFFQERESKTTNIGNDTWLGHGAIILPGVQVGDGAIVAAGSVVTKNVSPYAIVAGVPAKVIKYRFSEEIIEKLKYIQWWDWPIEDIKIRLRDFQGNIEDFVKKYDVI